MSAGNGQPVVTYHPIGVIRAPHKQPQGTPIQPKFAEGVQGTVEVFQPYVEGLKDLEGFERIWLIYHFHRAGEPRLRVVPYMDTVERGLFATRAPCRPNAIGISCVRLLAIEGNILHVADVDALDGTPLLDIKPYAAGFDAWDVQRNGWLGDVKPQDQSGGMRADERFH